MTVKTFQENKEFWRKTKFHDCTCVHNVFLLALIGLIKIFYILSRYLNLEKFCFSPKFFVFLRSLYCHFEKNPIFLEKVSFYSGYQVHCIIVFRSIFSPSSFFTFVHFHIQAISQIFTFCIFMILAITHMVTAITYFSHTVSFSQG